MSLVRDVALGTAVALLHTAAYSVDEVSAGGVAR
jgi:hypothetical protein